VSATTTSAWSPVAFLTVCSASLPVAISIFMNGNSSESKKEYLPILIIHVGKIDRTGLMPG
jgi:hypothetical protein